MPGVFERLRLNLATRHRARAASHSKDPFAREGPSGAALREPAAFQIVVARRFDKWLAKLGERAARQFAALQSGYLAAGAAARDISLRLAESRRYAGRDLVLNGASRMPAVAIVLAAILGAVTIWEPLAEITGWPGPILVVGTAVIGILDIALAAGVGAGCAALAFDESGPPFDLSPNMRTLTWVGTLSVGLCLLILVYVVAALRPGDLILWLALGYGATGLAMFAGAAAWEARFELLSQRLERELKDTLDQYRHIKVTYEAFERVVMNMASQMEATTRGILGVGEVAFARAWRRRPHGRSTNPPSVPEVDLPSESEQRQRLLVPLEPSGSRRDTELKQLSAG